MRQHPKYQKLLAAYRLAAMKINCDAPGANPTHELDDLMMTSYRLQKFIKEYLDSTMVGGRFVRVPYFGDAFKAAQEATDQSKGVHSLFLEAERLEALSRSTYRLLKLNDFLGYN